MQRRIEQPVSPLVAPFPAFGSPSAPVDGKAFANRKALHIERFSA